MKPRTVWIGLAVFLGAMAAHTAAAQLVESVRHIERPATARGPQLSINLFLDRHVYDNADLDAQGVVTLVPKAGDPLPRVTLRLRRGGRVLAEQTLAPREQMVAFLLPIERLAEGEYTLVAETKNGRERVSADHTFRRSGDGPRRDEMSRGRIRLTLPSPEEGMTGTWPVRTGVPFPKGMLWDASRVRLLGDGEEIPCQVEVRARWSPRGSVRWLGLDFTGLFEKGRRPSYELEYGVERAAEPVAPVTVTQDDSEVRVTTGSLRFSIRRQAYDGVHAAWLDRDGDGKFTDDEQVVRSDASRAPYIVDGDGVVYRASRDADVAVEVEREGPLHAVVRATGWFVSDDGERMCKYITYYEAFAGSPLVMIDHAVVFTFDTQTHTLTDVAFPLAARGERLTFGLDGQPVEAWRQERTYLLQDRWSRARVAGGATAEGSQADGWADVGDASLGVTLGAAYVPERFPKQFSISTDALTYHLWPPDAGDTFSDEEELSDRMVYQFLSAHEGPALNMRLLPKYVERITQLIGDRPLFDEERRILADPAGQNGQGVALNERFVLRFRGEALSPVEAATLVTLAEKDPHAAVDPDWIAGSGALGRMAGVDRENYPHLEDFMGRNLLSMASWHLKENEEYGVWNFGDVHTYWEWRPRRAGLHRTWLAAHYAQTEVPWLLYAHYADPAILDWARVNNHHVMNVDTIHYEDPAAPLRYHKTGAVYHCKGILHWGGDAAHATHYSYVSRLLWNWFMTGNRRARDVARSWHEGVIAAAPPGQQGRNGQTFLGEATEYYQNWWDPRMLELVTRTADTLMSDPPSEQHAMYWNPASFPRYYDLTKDPRMLEWLIGDPAFRSSGEAYGLSGYLYLVTGDDRFKDEWRNLYALVRKQYDNPESAYDGMVDPDWRIQMNGIYQLLYMQAAMKRAGVRIERPEDCGNPRIHTGTTAGGYRPVYTVGTIKHANEPVVLNVDNAYVGQLRVTGPDGHDITPAVQPVRGERKLLIPHNAPAGLYTLAFTASSEGAADREFPLPPVVNGEWFYLLKAGQTYTFFESGVAGGSQFVVRPLEGDAPLRLNVRVRKFPGQFILFGPEGDELLVRSAFQERYAIDVPSDGGPYTLMATRISYIVPERDAVATPYKGRSSAATATSRSGR